MTPAQNAIIERAWATYGAKAQIDQLVEECAEIIVAVSHVRRKRASLADFIDELADVTIMAQQVRLLAPDVFDLAVARKLERLQARLDEA